MHESGWMRYQSCFTDISGAASLTLPTAARTLNLADRNHSTVSWLKCFSGQQSLQALGAGCKMIDTLLLPPLVPCKYPTKFDDECCEMIAR